MSSNTIKARRRLAELYKTGVEVRFDDDPETGKPVGTIGPFLDEDSKPIKAAPSTVCVWVQPPNPMQRDMSMREGQAKRARALVNAKRNEDSEEHLTIISFLADMSDDTLVDYVLQSEQGTRMSEAEREVLARDDWKEMTAYQDAMRQFMEMDEDERLKDEEYVALMELDDKYSRQVAQREVELAAAQRDVLGFLSREILERKALEKRAEMVGSQAFITEYERCMLFYSIRDVDANDKLFFEDVNEMSSFADEVLEACREALFQFISDGAEAKNSQGAASGSDSSELPDKPETSEASTPQEQIA